MHAFSPAFLHRHVYLFIQLNVNGCTHRRGFFTQGLPPPPLLQFSDGSGDDTEILQRIPSVIPISHMATKTKYPGMILLKPNMTDMTDKKSEQHSEIMT